MKQKPELEVDHSLPHPSKRHKASSSQITCETALDCESDRLFDVFLNFRGPDSRHTVADVLYNSITHAGFRVFLDDEEIRKGEVIEGELLEAISNSSIYIPIFSKDYASSSFCLRELAKIIDCWESSEGDKKKVILPIFYDVDVSKDVKLRSQVYTTALQKHKDELGEVMVKPWESALRKVARIKGWNLNDHGLIELANLITKEVFSKLTTNNEAVPSVPDHLVGIDKRIEDIMRLLEEGSSDARLIVIHGMGGIGKTTLANAVFEKTSSRFRGSCFLKDVRRSSSDNDMVKLQEKLLSDTLNLKFIKICSINHGKAMLEQRLCNQTVLIVLDDVDKPDHLWHLAAMSGFGPNSRIIITTRNIGFLPTKDSYFYEMKEMDHGHALQLFCRYAFEKDRPPPAFYDISTEIVATTGGLPLSLQVIGSSLFNQTQATWKFRLEKLKEAPHKDVQETLMISYRALEYEQQQIFLDIACLFNDQKLKNPIYYWKACKLHPESGIEILVKRSMIKVYRDETLWMHDQLRDLGRTIAQPSNSCLESQLQAKPSRLWSPEVALDVVWRQEVGKSITALRLGLLDVGCHFTRKEFAKAFNLRFLQLQGGNFEGDFKNVFQQLRWLSWFDFPMKFEATNLSFKNLVILKLAKSPIIEDWNGWGVFMEAKHLKVLHLEECECLKKTPEFSAFLELERLIITNCLELEELDGSINKLKHLKYLEVSEDVDHDEVIPEVPPKPQLLPDSIGGLKSLIELKIEKVGLVELPSSIGELEKLESLCLRCPWLGNLPHSVRKLISLVELDLSYSLIEALPDSIGDLKRLKILRMEYSTLEYLPDTIGRLESLEELDLLCTHITQLPETIGNLKGLKAINVSGSKIKELPKAIVKLENLEKLYAFSCSEFDGKLPEEIGKLSCLQTLDLYDTKINRVPSSIDQLSHLEELNLNGIQEPQELSKLPTSILYLKVMSSSMYSHQIPDLSHMTNLVRLDLSYGLKRDPTWTSSPPMQTSQMKWLAKMPKLVVLVLYLPDLMSPPAELSSLSLLLTLVIRCFDLRSLTHLPSSLTNLTFYDVMSPIKWKLFSGLNNLSSLTLTGCYQLEKIKVDFLERLETLEICDCPHLVDIEGVGKLKSLRLLVLFQCTSIQGLADLSRLKELQKLTFHDCKSLESVPKVAEEALCWLVLKKCKYFQDFEGPAHIYNMNAC